MQNCTVMTYNNFTDSFGAIFFFTFCFNCYLESLSAVIQHACPSDCHISGAMIIHASFFLSQGRTESMCIESSSRKLYFLKGNCCKNMKHESSLYTAFDDVFLLMKNRLTYGKR